jgi:hypothetical protein
LSFEIHPAPEEAAGKNQFLMANFSRRRLISRRDGASPNSTRAADLLEEVEGIVLRRVSVTKF